MSKVIKQVSPQELQAWSVPPNSKINYYDGKLLIVSDAEPEAPFGIAAKAGISALFGIAVFTHAPLVGMVCAAYAAYKVTETVRGLYGGDNALTSRLEQDLGIVAVEEVATPTIAPQSESLPAATDSGPVATSSPIGNHTRLRAVEVPASPAADSSHEATALSALLTSPFLSRAWFGAQRTGKSYLAAVASLELSRRGISIYHLNLASYGDEDATYWQHAVKSVRCDLSNLSEMQAQPFIENAIALVHEFFSTRNAILVFDEITLTGSLSNQHSSALDPLLRLVADKIACLASTGTKRAQAIWTLSPDFVAGALSQQTKAVKSLALVFVAISPGRSVDWNGNRIGFHAESFGNVQRNFPVLTMPSSNAGCDRICFVDGRWLPVGELPSLEDSKPLKQTIKLNDRQQLEAAFKVSTADQEAPIEEAKSNISKPNLPAKDLMLAIAMLAEWMEENLDVEAEKIYEKYNARRKGFSRPEIRFLLTQIENLTDP